MSIVRTSVTYHQRNVQLNLNLSPLQISALLVAGKAFALQLQQTTTRVFKPTTTPVRGTTGGTMPPWLQLGLPGVSQSLAVPSIPVGTTPSAQAPPKKPDPLWVDLYAGDNNAPDWNALHSNTNYYGAIIKATEGLYYNGGKWFSDNWKAISPKYTGARTLPWHRGAYHYLKFNQDGDAQATFYLKTIAASGGWEDSDLFPIVDVEMGGAGDSNQKGTASQVVAVTTAFATRVAKETGRPCILYGNGAMRDLGITSRMGCEYLWIPRYTPTLPAVTYTRAGWDQSRLLFWQYCGDGQGYLAGYPTTSPLGHTDISVLTLPGGLVGLAALLAKYPTHN